MSKQKNVGFLTIVFSYRIGTPTYWLEQIDEERFQMYYGPVKLAILDDRAKKIIRPPLKRKKRT